MDMALLHVPFSHGFDTGKRYPVTTIPMLGLDCDFCCGVLHQIWRGFRGFGSLGFVFYSFKEYIDDDHR